MTKTLNQIATEIADLPFIEKAAAWTKVAGKERIYIDFKRYDRKGKYVGSGGTMIYEVSTGRMTGSIYGYNGTPFCNSYTASFHADADSLAKVRAIIGL